ncbi:cytochrome-c peroxidase [Stenotrophomonas rhizophila]
MQKVLTVTLLLLAPCPVLLSGCTGAQPAAEASSAALGRKLFFDTRLSADSRTSCASCHVPERYFTDGLAVSRGASGQVGTRNAPALGNLPKGPAFFWDGRETGRAQALTAAFETPAEMGHSSLEPVLQQLEALSDYRSMLTPPVTREQLASALDAYLESIPATKSAFERAMETGEPRHMTDSAQRGMRLFKGKAQCVACHLMQEPAATFTDGKFHYANVGFERIAGNIKVLQASRATQLEAAGSIGQLVLSNTEIAALGRFAATSSPADLAAFRTPALKNVAHTSPYMHDGSVATLEDVVEHELYYRGLATGAPLSLTVEEQADLVAFLHSLSE